MKDWFRDGKSKWYCKRNRILVKKAVKFYNKYWKLCNDLYYSDEKQKTILNTWAQKLKEKAMVIDRNVKQFILGYETKENSSLNYIKDWICNLQVFIKNFDVYGEEDIRRYIEVKSKSLKKEK